MRAHRSLVLALCAGVIGGCTGAAATGPTLTPSPAAPPTPVAAPAAAAGGACELLDYDAVNRALGTDFNIAAATSSGRTATCVVQATGASRPDLLLTVSPTKADAAVFRSEVVPDGARHVQGLGRVAYRTTTKGGGGRGPTAEVGWLSRDGRLLTLRYTFPAGVPRSAAYGQATRLAALAKALDARG